jgi:hypothetical protein
MRKYILLQMGLRQGHGLYYLAYFLQMAQIEPVSPPDQVPVFKPTYEQFKDFESFVKMIEPIGLSVGLVKVVPPKEWLDMMPTAFDRIHKLQIKNSISQEFYSGGLTPGAFRQINIESKKSYSVEQWFDLAASTTPFLDDSGRLGVKRKRTPLQESKDNAITASFPQTKKKLDTHLDQLYKPQEYSDIYLDAVEKHYWKNVSFQTPMYGADLPGSLFTNRPNSWNVARLNNLLNRYPFPVPGVNMPYLYFGMYKSTFAWHLEDMDLCSIKYNFFDLVISISVLQNAGTLSPQNTKMRLKILLHVLHI